MGFLWRQRRSGSTPGFSARASECGVRITQSAGSAAGQSRLFAADTDEILIGRDTNWAGFALPEDDKRASRRHLQLKRQAGGAWEAVRLAGNYTEVNGRPVTARARLADGDVLTLGRKDGPTLRFELVPPDGAAGLADPDLTEDQGTIHDTEQVIDRLKRHMALIAASLAVVVVAGGYMWMNLDTRMGELTREMEAAAARAQQEPDGWRAPVEALRAATHAVIARRDGLEWAVATAWRISDTQLVTNAHVAAELAGRSNLEVLVRSAGGEREFAVTGITMHPAYRAFTDHLAARRAGTETPEGFRPLRLPGAYDLAILEIAPGAEPGPALDYLKPGEEAGLWVGMPVAFAGYFLRDIAGAEFAHKDAEPRVHFGTISALTNFFLFSADEDGSQLVHNTIPLTGGTSGGPVIDQNGRVVAVISSGTVVSVPSAGASAEDDATTRVPSAALVNYAQRTDLLHHLLGGETSRDEQADWTSHWDAELARFDDYGQYVLDRFLEDAARSDGRRYVPVREPVRQPVERNLQIADFPLRLEEGRGYAIMAYSHGPEPVWLRVNSKGEEIHADRGDPARVRFTAETSGDVTLEVITSSASPTSFELFVYRTE